MDSNGGEWFADDDEWYGAFVARGKFRDGKKGFVYSLSLYIIFRVFY